MKITIFLLFISSCSLFFGGNKGPETAKGSHYSIPFSMPYWEYKKDERSDYVFQNARDGRILLSNSFCNEFQEKPLDKLALKTFNTVSSFKPEVSRYTTFRDREAYLVEGKGFVDGVEVKLRLLNTRRNNCYFDFFAISPKGTADNEEAFNNFLNSVVFR